MPDYIEMYRQKAPSTLAKSTFTVLHLSAVLAATWLLFGGGISMISEQLHMAPIIGPALRRALLLAASVTYFLRVVVTIFVFMKRRMGWSEVYGVAVLLAALHVCFAFFGGRQTTPVGMIEGIGLFLYVAGSFLNSGAEYQRHVWKQRPEHQGRLYTEGLFRYAMHINYFGDVVLFTGWVLLTARWILLAIPLFIVSGFVRMYVPTLDRYLAERYGQAFRDYSAHTKKLIPFLY